MVQFDFPQVVLRHPLAAVWFMLGRKQVLQDAMILDAAHYLYGDSVDKPLWRKALAEMNRLEVEPMNSLTVESLPAPTTAVVGNLAHTTLGKFLYASINKSLFQKLINISINLGKISEYKYPFTSNSLYAFI